MLGGNRAECSSRDIEGQPALLNPQRENTTMANYYISEIYQRAAKLGTIDSKAEY